MNYEELDEETRQYMLKEFQNEEKSGNPYRRETMSSEGLKNSAKLVEESIKKGN